MQGGRLYNLYTLKGSTDAGRGGSTDEGGNGCDATSCSASPCTDMPVQSFKTNWQYWAVFKRNRSLMFMFCRNILLLWNILTFKQLFACQASSTSVHSFLIFNILINLYAICISNIVQQIEVILLDPVHHIILSIRANDYTGITNFACQLHNCYLISTDIARPVVLCCHLVKLLLISQH